MQTERARSEDIPALCELLNVLFDQESEFTPDAAAQATGLALILEAPEKGVILVAREADRIIGMINLLYTISTALGSRVAIVEDMVVRPECRGAGCGSVLLSRAIEIAREAGCRRITLLTDQDNISAQRFYKRHGFTQSAMTPFRLLLDS